MKSQRSQRKLCRRRGLSIIEVVVSTLLVGVVLVGALRCVGAVITGQVYNGDSVRATLLAHDLMAEILSNAYLDPGASPIFGAEPGEPGQRELFDDVDDYHGWSASPPEGRTGVAYPALTDWQRDVTVEWVQRNDPALVSAIDQGVKRVTVTVSRNGEVLSRLVALRSNMYVFP